MTAAYFLLPLDLLGPRRPVLSWTLLVLALGVIALLLLRQTGDVLTDRPGTRPGFAIPLLMCASVLVFAGAYYVLASEPGGFDGLRTRVDALYFTLVTLATIGYGDITATGQSARVLTILQILYTFVFLTAAATAFSRRVRGVVSLRHRRADPAHPPESDDTRGNGGDNGGDQNG
ncbi:potassium channel family protein [Streptomyces cavernicola]|uniref:Potassium channel family protein n=1 Tax=Streptomyces cavernicola TaxID=3043613 RepID=A0ABT6SCU7_9ACTN|nr:potassium channel family protein [Streptomyces sp. B-S-A6]MDI3406025.1 potassium channel family protein [Streptomyces sp. B-S-A6]